MANKRGPWTIKETSSKYKNDFIEVSEDQVIQPDGKPGSYATVAMKSGVCVLPIEDDGTVYLTKQFRYALGAESLEVVSGAIDEGESPAAAARRELREELGIEANELLDMGRLQLDTSIIKAPVQLYLARGLGFVKPEQEGTETIKLIRMKFDEVMNAVRDSVIVHGPSCVLILKAASYRSSKSNKLVDGQ
jgi:ADP-ribose pyrophosphatase